VSYPTIGFRSWSPPLLQATGQGGGPSEAPAGARRSEAWSGTLGPDGSRGSDHLGPSHRVGTMGYSLRDGGPPPQRGRGLEQRPAFSRRSGRVGASGAPRTVGQFHGDLRGIGAGPTLRVCSTASRRDAARNPLRCRLPGDRRSTSFLGPTTEAAKMVITNPTAAPREKGSGVGINPNPIPPATPMATRKTKRDRPAETRTTGPCAVSVRRTLAKAIATPTMMVSATLRHRLVIVWC
jgi:hypothetical protein